VRHELHGDVRVVSASGRSLFNPSLIWLPFGKRRPADITFPVAPTYESHGIDFVHAQSRAFRPPPGELVGGPVVQRPVASREVGEEPVVVVEADRRHCLHQLVVNALRH
jgi:hypothetical protein